MPRVEIVKRVPVPSSYRVARVCAAFDLPERSEREFRLQLDVPLPQSWQIGVITGPSGAGKSSLAAELFGAGALHNPLHAAWPALPLVDAVAPQRPVDEVLATFAAVGLNSVPTYLSPYAALSTGEQFRASMARVLLEAGQQGQQGQAGRHSHSHSNSVNGDSEAPLVIDEFTSVVDRIVARSVSVALARHVRRTPRLRVVLVTCHQDVVPYLQPDWVIELDGAGSGRCLRWCPPPPRPPIELRLVPASRSAWPLFARHHYLSGALASGARCWLGLVRFTDQPALAAQEPERVCAFVAVLSALRRGWVRGHRTVVLPDYQGIGIGNALLEALAEYLWVQEGKRFQATTSARAIIEHRRRRPDRWRLVSGPRNNPPSGCLLRGKPVRRAAGRLTTSWEYVPLALRASAAAEMAHVAHAAHTRQQALAYAKPDPVEGHGQAACAIEALQGVAALSR